MSRRIIVALQALFFIISAFTLQACFGESYSPPPGYGYGYSSYPGYGYGYEQPPLVYGDYDDHHVWHDRDWWERNDRDWAQQHHPEWSASGPRRDFDPHHDSDDHHPRMERHSDPARNYNPTAHGGIAARPHVGTSHHDAGAEYQTPGHHDHD